MKKAGAYLNAFQEAEKRAGGAASDSLHARTIVMATVRADVHDIGKNHRRHRSGSGRIYYRYRLGVMVPCEKILQAARDNQADIDRAEAG